MRKCMAIGGKWKCWIKFENMLEVGVELRTCKSNEALEKIIFTNVMARFRTHEGMVKGKRFKNKIPN